MNKQIFILNGTAGAGKDSFANLLNEFYPTRHISSITPVKAAAETLGWSGEKTPEYRKFLCEFKKFLNEQGNIIWDYLDKEVEDFRKDDKTQILLIDIREPDEIKKAVKRYNAKTILIYRNNSIKCFSNYADNSVDNYTYDITIENTEPLEKFRKTVELFAFSIAYIFHPEWTARNTDKKTPQNKIPFNSKVVAVDFDNTIAKTKFPVIIEPIWETIELILQLKQKGATIVLWTCREGDCLNDALSWCRMYGIPIDYVNENPKSRTEYWGNDCRKIGADLYIDDKSFSLSHDRRDAQDIIDKLFG